MKYFFYGVLFLVISIVALIVMAPLSFVLEKAKANAPALGYASAKGTIWNGEIDQLRYDLQPIGDVKVSTQWASLLTGQWHARISLTDGAITANGDLFAGLGGTLVLKDLRARGSTSELLSLRDEIRELNGEFTLSLRDMRVRADECISADGLVWTDALTRLERSYSWTGPEMNGRITCEDGLIVLRLSGENETGEAIHAEVFVGMDATGRFKAVIDRPSNELAQAATILGFITYDDQLIYEHKVP